MSFSIIIIEASIHLSRSCATYRYSFCVQAAKRNLVYPNYAWIFYALYPNQWWTDSVIPVDCTNEELESFVLRSRGILAHIVPEPDDFDSITAAGIVSLRHVYTFATLVSLWKMRWIL